MFDRLGQLLVLQQRVGQVGQAERIVRMNSERGAVMCDRFLDSPDLEQGGADPALRDIVILRNREGVRPESHRTRPISGLPPGDNHEHHDNSGGEAAKDESIRLPGRE